MRNEKVEFERDVGGVKDRSWISVSEDDQSYELAMRIDLKKESDNYTEWNTADIDDPGYLDDNNEMAEVDSSSRDGFRTLKPGTSRQVKTPFSLDHGVHEGLLGELQAASIYQSAEEYIDSGDITLYDFVEWYQQETKRFKHSLVEIGPELAFGLPNSGIEENGLMSYLSAQEHNEGDRLMLSQSDGVVNQSAEEENGSILRQSGLEAVNGILTQNPKEVREMVDEK